MPVKEKSLSGSGVLHGGAPLVEFENEGILSEFGFGFARRVDATDYHFIPAGRKLVSGHQNLDLFAWRRRGNALRKWCRSSFVQHGDEIFRVRSLPRWIHVKRIEHV